MEGSAQLAHQAFHVLQEGGDAGVGVRGVGQLHLQVLLHLAAHHAQVSAVQGLAHGGHLAGDVQAGLAFFDHALDAAQLAFSALEAVEDVRSVLVVVEGGHDAGVRMGQGCQDMLNLHCAMPYIL